MSLEYELSALKTEALSRTEPRMAEVSQEAISRLVESGIAQRAIKTGDTAPDFDLPDVFGQNRRLIELLEAGPMILIFYRGQWCPFCNLTLRSYQAALPAIRKFRGQLIAVSSQKPDRSVSMKELNQLTFPVLSDTENKTAADYGLLFPLPKSLIEVFKARKIDLTSINGKATWELPVPAIYVISQEGKVIAHHVDPDHRNRMDPETAVCALKALLSA